jgi:hypothetical protein
MDLRVYNERIWKYQAGHIKEIETAETELYRITLSNGFSVLCSADQKFLVRYGYTLHKKDWFSIQNGLDINYKILVNGIKKKHLHDYHNFVSIKSIQKESKGLGFNLEIVGENKGFVVNNIVTRGK